MSNILPVITLYQPWATWVMRGWKSIETRTHNRFACLNGKTILIHAGQRTDGSDAVIKNPYLTRDQILHNPDEVINGAILGSVHVSNFLPLNYTHSQRALIDCESTLRFGLFLTNPMQLQKPVYCKGSMGIWYFNMDTMQKITKPSPLSFRPKGEI